ncbi:SlyX family protein [Salinicola salarius]|uniref:SlyX family protein n=1 Tax=Salinicola salarius TaxID=430457 RepID=UPI0023E44301|nr:SlyX family protein [Salinicola salarius]MDF3920543.1 SlyX family protein [Salinicola salarius]
MKDDTQPWKSNTVEPTSRTSLEARLDTLESRVAFQDDWLETLDRLVREQANELEKLTRLNQLMRERLSEQRQAIDDLGGDVPRPEDELPPHY